MLQARQLQATQGPMSHHKLPPTHLLSATRARFLMPAVSISVRSCPPGSVIVVSTASLVVPLMSQTMDRSSPQMAFSRLLLPVRQLKAAHTCQPGGRGVTLPIAPDTGVRAKPTT